MHSGSIKLGLFRKPPEEALLTPEESPGQSKAPFRPERVLWKLRNYVGGSWTSYRRLARSLGSLAPIEEGS